MLLRSLYIPALLGVLCIGANTAQARRTPVTIQPGAYRLSYDTSSERWDNHTQASSIHRGVLTLTIKRGGATLTLKDRWSYRSSSDHGVSGAPIRLLFRNIGYHYTWRGRHKRARGRLDVTLAVASATCTAFSRRGGGAGRKTTCEERPVLRLVCKLGSDRVHRAAKADVEDPGVIKRGEAARPVQTLHCSSPAPPDRACDPWEDDPTDARSAAAALQEEVLGRQDQGRAPAALVLRPSDFEDRQSSAYATSNGSHWGKC
jgi:hypothetical protein